MSYPDLSETPSSSEESPEDKVYPWQEEGWFTDSILGRPEYNREHEDVPVGDEIPALEAWKAQNLVALSKLSKRKRYWATNDALQEIRAQLAREQIQASSPDEAAGPDAADDEGA